MSKIKFYKVTSLPGTLVANAMYFVENGTYAETYLTNTAGVARSVGNSSMITAIANALISAAGGSWVEVVADIAERDLLTLTVNTVVLVKDASADPTVTSGAALYIYEASLDTFSKIAEYESMDVVLSWTNITGRPTSTPGQIDAAVTNSHTHANKSSLDKIGQDGEGDITYDSNAVMKWSTVNW